MSRDRKFLLFEALAGIQLKKFSGIEPLGMLCATIVDSPSAALTPALRNSHIAWRETSVKAKPGWLALAAQRLLAGCCACFSSKSCAG